MSLAVSVLSLDLGRELPPRSRLVPVVAAPIAPLPLPAIPVRVSVRHRLLSSTARDNMEQLAAPAPA